MSAFVQTCSGTPPRRSSDNPARVWRVFMATQNLVNLAKNRVGRCLTPTQRKSFSYPWPRRVGASSGGSGRIIRMRGKSGWLREGEGRICRRQRRPRSTLGVRLRPYRIPDAAKMPEPCEQGPHNSGSAFHRLKRAVAAGTPERGLHTQRVAVHAAQGGPIRWLRSVAACRVPALVYRPFGRAREANWPSSSASPGCDAPSPWLRRCLYRGQSVC
jgi:hypothetical protein